MYTTLDNFPYLINDYSYSLQMITGNVIKQDNTSLILNNY